jgi:hypothetical protein
MSSLSGQNIKDTFQKLVQVDDGGLLQNGIGGNLGQVTLTGSIAASSGFIGTLEGNATSADSATTATSASFASTSSLARTATSASFTTTASLARTATSASFASTSSLAQTALTASVAATASYTVTASYSATASNATLLAGKDVAQFITTGSTDTTQYITGSIRVTQNLDVLGTASFQYVTASQTVVDQNTIIVYASSSGLPTAGLVAADTSSQYSGSSFLYNIVDAIWTLDAPLSASLTGTASWANTASNAISSSYTVTASYSATSNTSSYALTASLSTTASNAVTASYLDMYATASYALTASYLSGSINVDTGSLLITSSLSGSSLIFTKGDGTTFDIELPANGASGSNRVFEFNSPSTQWDMPHNFGEQHVSVTLYNENHLQIGASQISASDANNASAYFTYPVAGYAMVLAAGGTTNITVSGSANIETGSFATTGSNTFIGNQQVTGSVDITGSLYLNGVSLAPGTVATASYAETASYVLGSIESSSYASVANSLNILNQTVTITGSLLMTGNVNNVTISAGAGNVGGNVALGTTLPNIDASGGGDAGQYNVGIGESSLTSVTTGNYNTATNRSLVLNTTGVWNTAYGYNTMFFNTTGNRNVAIGMWALASIDGSDNNVALGTEAGRFSLAGSMSQSSGSIYIGSLTKAKANNETNQIVIGTDAVGSGSNTTTIGNNNTTHTYLKGQVVAPSFTGSFEANGTTNTTGSGLFITAPNGNRYKLTVDNSGNLTTVLA